MKGQLLPEWCKLLAEKAFFRLSTFYRASISLIYNLGLKIPLRIVSQSL
jgi:hypothetical protein